jgi:hypothetical protein
MPIPTRRHRKTTDQAGRLAGRLPRHLVKALRILALEQDTTVEALLTRLVGAPVFTVSDLNSSAPTIPGVMKYVPCSRPAEGIPPWRIAPVNARLAPEARPFGQITASLNGM